MRKGLSENGYHSFIFDKKFYYLEDQILGKSKLILILLFFFLDNGFRSERRAVSNTFKGLFFFLHFKNGFTEINYTYNLPLNSMAFSVFHRVVH